MTGMGKPGDEQTWIYDQGLDRWYGGTAGGGASSTSSLWISPANIGSYEGAVDAGNFTVGMIFQLFASSSITGIRFYGTWSGLKNWKVRVVNWTLGSGLGDVTSNGLLQGINTVSLTSSVQITNLGQIYAVTVYDVTGSIFPGRPVGGVLTRMYPISSDGLLGQTLFLHNNAAYIAGDGIINATNSSDRMFVEPVFL
jgi:hypothetical protein